MLLSVTRNQSCPAFVVGAAALLIVLWSMFSSLPKQLARRRLAENGKSGKQEGDPRAFCTSTFSVLFRKSQNVAYRFAEMMPACKGDITS